MPNNLEYIPSGGIEQIEYDLDERGWYAIQSWECNEEKVIPFLKLIIDLRALLIKYYKNQTRQGRYINYPPKAIRTVGITLFVS